MVSNDSGRFEPEGRIDSLLQAISRIRASNRRRYTY